MIRLLAFFFIFLQHLRFCHLLFSLIKRYRHQYPKRLVQPAAEFKRTLSDWQPCVCCGCVAVEGRLETLASGGECISKRYMEFSHLCTVRDYLPTVDYCCCAHHQLVLCCRYHQNWNHFRCNDADDVLMMTYVHASLFSTGPNV